MSKDWTGGRGVAIKTMGAPNSALNDREVNDYYATEPKAMTLLLEQETFSPVIWECACGEGHLSKVLEDNGYRVVSSDLIDRGYGQGGVDFLKCDKPFNGDIITNPPYKYGLEFVQHALELIPTGNRVAMFLKLQFLEGKRRRQFFNISPPRTIYVSFGRLHCAKNADWEKYMKMNAITYAWFVWEKGWKGEPGIRWIN